MAKRTLVLSRVCLDLLPVCLYAGDGLLLLAGWRGQAGVVRGARALHPRAAVGVGGGGGGEGQPAHAAALGAAIKPGINNQAYHASFISTIYLKYKNRNRLLEVMMLLILRVTEEKWWCCNTRGRGANHLIDDGWMGSKKAVMVAESSQRSGQPGAGTECRT